MATSASPKNPESTEKSKRYDRQLRLWGENGQQALESSHVCLINGNIVGTEILKSLVLPGIRAFTIIDDGKVTEDDMDGNFFLCADGSLGESRAKIAAQSLMEMNSDVKKGDYVEENFESLLDQNERFFTNFTLVIACGIDSERSLNKLSRQLWNLNVPLLVVKSIGYLGYIRLQIREHHVIEPHPDNYLEDLRMDALFPELKEYFDSFPTFDGMSRKELSRVPALVIIYRALLKWREENGKSDSEIPTVFREKKALSTMIKQQMNALIDALQAKAEAERAAILKNGDDDDETVLTIQTGVQLELENFEEAGKMVNKVFFDSRKIPDNLQTLLDEVKDDTSKKYSSPFWAMIGALHQFYTKTNHLPLKGTVPDMNCGSEEFITLQKIYKAKAKQDADKMFKLAQMLPKSTNVVISETQVQTLCRNAPFLTVIRTSAIAEELSGKALRQLAGEQLQNGAEEDGAEYDELRFYVLMRLVERFHSKQNRYPGQREDQVESDVAELKRELRELCIDLGVNMFIKDELIHEICRYGGCELHSISAFLGGAAAHEAIKLVTGQYVPINSTFVYNALNSTTITYSL